MQQQLIDRGLEPKAARRAADRLSAIKSLEEQGMSPTEAAAQSKKELAGAQKLDAISIPKESLSQEENLTMSNLSAAGKVQTTPSSYTVMTDHGKDVQFSPETEKPVSFSTARNIPGNVSPETHGSPVYSTEKASLAPNDTSHATPEVEISSRMYEQPSIMDTSLEEPSVDISYANQPMTGIDGGAISQEQTIIHQKEPFASETENMADNTKTAIEQEAPVDMDYSPQPEVSAVQPEQQEVEYSQEPETETEGGSITYSKPPVVNNTVGTVSQQRVSTREDYSQTFERHGASSTDAQEYAQQYQQARAAGTPASEAHKAVKQITDPGVSPTSSGEPHSGEVHSGEVNRNGASVDGGSTIPAGGSPVSQHHIEPRNTEPADARARPVSQPRPSKGGPTSSKNGSKSSKSKSSNRSKKSKPRPSHTSDDPSGTASPRRVGDPHRRSSDPSPSSSEISREDIDDLMKEALRQLDQQMSEDELGPM